MAIEQRATSSVYFRLPQSLETRLLKKKSRVYVMTIIWMHINANFLNNFGAYTVDPSALKVSLKGCIYDVPFI
jgi:hypothetical protein